MATFGEITEWIFIIIILLIILTGVGVFLYLVFGTGSGLPPPSPSFAPEKNFDPNMPTPTDSLVLAHMYPGSTTPWCIGTYYSLRYVDNNGNYGPVGPWTPQVIASLANATCGTITPRISINFSPEQQVYANKYSVNVHRQVGNILDNSSDGVPIGELQYGGNTGDNGVQYSYQYIDHDNPASTQNCPTGNNGC